MFKVAAAFADSKYLRRAHMNDATSVSLHKLHMMKPGRVHCLDEGPDVGIIPDGASRSNGNGWATVMRKLTVAWLVVGLAPFVFQTRSFLKFVAPHVMSETLVVPPGAERLTADLTVLCPALGFRMTEVWWNIESTHYYEGDRGRLCHFVSPQYNCHGNYVVGTDQVKASLSAPARCSNNSYAMRMYFYHGTIGFYSFYEELTGTYCTEDHTLYGVIANLGTYDINGSLLAEDGGGYGSRMSYWYATVGSVWILYRALVLRRSLVACRRYGRRCDQMGENLDRRTLTVFVHESMRLSAHGATNYHRMALLYLLVEGIMSDLFLLVVTEGFFANIQYISFGYNLSAVTLLSFEMIENMGWLRESTRLSIKRLLFSYESSLVGELLSSFGQSYFLTGLSHSELKHTGPTARAVSYYVWGLVGHAVIVLPLIGSIMLVRIVRAVTFARWEHGVWLSVFTAPCCVDTTLGMLNKMVMLRGYEWNGGKLCYKPDALKAFGILKMEEEDGTELLAVRKTQWLAAPASDLTVIGVVSGHRVEPCAERPCLGVVSFCSRSLGGDLSEAARRRPSMIHGRSRNSILPALSALNVFPAP
jgi:hypothetical protein